MELGINLGRFLTGALISAALAIGGVWFVVDIAIRGIETAVVATNSRVGDLQERLSRVEDKIDTLQIEIIKGFKDTQQELKKASLDIPTTDPRQTAAIDYSGEWQKIADDLVKINPDTSTSNYTIFAPSDFAFASSSSSPEDRKHLIELLGAYKVEGNYTPQSMLDSIQKSGGSLNLKTVNGKTLSATSTLNNKYILISDSTGNVANILGKIENSENISIYEIDNTLDVQ